MLNNEEKKDTENENKSGSRKSSDLMIGNSNQDLSKIRKSTRSSGDRNNDNGNSGDNDSNTEYLTFERSQQGEGEREQAYNGREY